MNKLEKMRQLFLQAKKSYKKNQIDFFNPAFAVPTEILYKKLCKLDSNSADRRIFRSMFYARLKELISKGKEFNAEYLSEDIIRAISNKPKIKYRIDFGVPIKKSILTPLPFGRTISLDGIKFTQKSYEQFKKNHKEECLNDYYRHCKENLYAYQNLNSVLRNFYYFRANIESTDSLSAVQRAVDAFEVLYSCATVAQNSNKKRYTLSSTKLKSRSVMSPAGILLVSSENNNECELMWTFDIRMESDESLDFTKNKRKMERFKIYKKICQEKTPISKRVRSVILEMTKALHAREPHIRQLGLWRCLEIATSINNGGQARTEKEIIQILSKFIKNSTYWRQQGDLIKEARNKYVHEGLYLESDSRGSFDDYLNWTQEYVEAVLSILVWIRRKKIGLESPGEIDDFFDFYPKDTATLKIAGKLLNGRSMKF